VQCSTDIHIYYTAKQAEESGGGGGWSLGVVTQAHKRIQTINMKKRGLCNDTLTEEKVILNFILKKQGVTSWIGFMLHRANTNSRFM
jgi:hypothetical protein